MNGFDRNSRSDSFKGIRRRRLAILSESVYINIKWGGVERSKAPIWPSPQELLIVLLNPANPSALFDTRERFIFVFLSLKSYCRIIRADSKLLQLRQISALPWLEITPTDRRLRTWSLLEMLAGCSFLPTYKKCYPIILLDISCMQWISDLCSRSGRLMSDAGNLQADLMSTAVVLVGGAEPLEEVLQRFKATLDFVNEMIWIWRYTRCNTNHTIGSTGSFFTCVSNYGNVSFIISIKNKRKYCICDYILFV